mgnify:CR=1 FL=1
MMFWKVLRLFNVVAWTLLGLYNLIARGEISKVEYGIMWGLLVMYLVIHAFY